MKFAQLLPAKLYFPEAKNTHFQRKYPYQLTSNTTTNKECPISFFTLNKMAVNKLAEIVKCIGMLIGRVSSERREDQ